MAKKTKPENIDLEDLEEIEFETAKSANKRNIILPENLARNKNGTCKLTKYCPGKNCRDCLMREKAYYQHFIFEMGKMPSFYYSRQRRTY
jgi:hypothetical protein